MASPSMAHRCSILGQSEPRMCSFNASPVPSPRKNRPFINNDEVAAAWATIADEYAESDT